MPRPSKKEGKIIEWLVAFAQKHGFDYQTDETGNVVMRKAATPGFEDRPAVILQSHMDMVCEKNSNVEFDFEQIWQAVLEIFLFFGILFALR